MTAAIRDSLAQVQELKPCPMCGGEAHLERQGHVACKTGWPCVHTAYFNWGTPEEQNAAAIAAWNTRHRDADRSAELTTAWMAGAESVRERAAEDSARLDWLIEREARALKFADGYQVFSPLYCQDRRYPTAREAIDAARAGERG